MEKNKLLFPGLIVLASVFYVSHSTQVIYDSSNVSKYSAKGGPIQSNYTPRGENYEIGNLSVYESQNRNSNRLLIAVHDLLGMSTNLKQIVDTIAERYDFRVVMPDFYRGFLWDENDIPPENPQDLIDWLERNASWDKVVKYDLLNVMNTFQTRDNISEVGIFGMCWGGKVSTLAATHLSNEIKAAALVHPTYVTNDEADGVNSPMYLLPTSNDPDMLPFYEVLKEKFGNNSGHRRFDDMRHGFAGTKGDWMDPLVVQRVEELIGILGGFFNRNVNRS